jgi:DNA topoisomerase-2
MLILKLWDYSGKDIRQRSQVEKEFPYYQTCIFSTPVKGIYKYSSPEEILKDFVDLRT